MAEPGNAPASDHFFTHMQSSPPIFLTSRKLTLINLTAESSPHDWLLVTLGQGEKPADDWKVEKRNSVAFIPWHLAPLSLVAAVSLSVIAPARLWSILFPPHLLRNMASSCCPSGCHTVPCLSCPVCLPTKVFCLRHLN